MPADVTVEASFPFLVENRDLEVVLVEDEPILVCAGVRVAQSEPRGRLEPEASVEAGIPSRITAVSPRRLASSSAARTSEEPIPLP